MRCQPKISYNDMFLLHIIEMQYFACKNTFCILQKMQMIFLACQMSPESLC